MVVSLLVGRWAGAADRTLLVEGESIRGLPSVSAGEAEGGKAAVFEKGYHSVTVQSPGLLAEGLLWAKVRLCLAAPDGLTQVRLSLKGGGQQEAMVCLAQFAWFRVCGSSDGRTAPALQIDFEDGPRILIDRVVFEPARDAASLPAPAPWPRAGRIAVLAADSQAARAEADLLRQRLARMGQTNVTATASADQAAPGPDSACVLCCGEWDEPAALRWLPDWAAQPAASQAAWVCKPPGAFGLGAALGVRVGAGQSVPDSALAQLLGQGAERIVCPLKPASPAYFRSVSIDLADALSHRDSAALGSGLASPYGAIARAAADRLLQWLDSPETLGSFPPAAVDWFPAALGDWLYRADEWGLTTWERALYGDLFARLAGLAEQSLQAPQAAQGLNGILSPAQAGVASTLYWAARGFGAAAPGGQSERWLHSAEALVADGAQRGLAEFARGRLLLLRDLWDMLSQRGNPEPAVRRLAASVEMLAGGPDNLCAFGDEQPFFRAAELEGLGLPPPIRQALKRGEQPGGIQLRRLDVPSQATAGGRESAPFDKVVFRGPHGSFAVLDGLSGGPGGYPDALALLRYGDSERVWLGGPGPGAFDAKSQNGVTLSVEAQRVGFSGLANREAELTGGSSALAVAVLRGEGGGQWRRGVFAFAQPEALIVIDRLAAGRAGRAEAACRWRVLGKAQRVSPEHTCVEQDGRLMDVWLLGSGEKGLEARGGQELDPWQSFLKPGEGSHVLRQRWAGSARAEDEIFFGAAFLARRAGGPAAAAAVQGLASGGVRLGSDAAAFLGSIAEPGLGFEGTALCVSPAQILLAGAKSLTSGAQWILADAPLDLALNPSDGTMEAMAQRNTTLNVRIPAGVEIQGAVAQRAGEFAAIALPIGPCRLQLSDRNALQPLFQSALAAVGSLKGGPAGAAPSSGAEKADSTGFNLFQKTLPTEGPIVCFGPVAVFGGEPRVLFSTQGGAIGWVDPLARLIKIVGLDSPAQQIQAVDLDLDGERDIVAGCADSTVRVFSPGGQERGRTQLGDHAGSGTLSAGGVRFLAPLDVENDGLPELAAACGDGSLTILDHLGRRRAGASFRGAPTSFAIGDFEGDGRPEILVGTSLGQRMAVAFDPDGHAVVAEAAQAGSPVVCAAFVGLEASGKAEAVFGDDDGTIAVFARREGPEFRMEELWRKTLGDEAVSALIGLPAGDSARLVAASGSGFVLGLGAKGAIAWIEYLDGPISALSESGLSGGKSGWLAATETGSLYALTPEKKMRQRLEIGRAIRFIARSDPSASHERFFLAGDSSVQILDRGK